MGNTLAIKVSLLKKGLLQTNDINSNVHFPQLF